MRFTLATEPHSDKLLWLGVGLAVGGALIMPSVLPKVKEIIVVVQGVPIIGAFLGGRRATDPKP